MLNFIFLSVILLVSITGLYPPASIIYTLQYENNGLYTTGTKDILFVAFLTNLWLLVRSVIIKIKFGMGSKETRFREQFYQACVYSSTFAYGMYNYIQSDYKYDWLNTIKGYPHQYVTYHVKMYFMLVLSMWVHMVFVLFMEKKRKDHYMMLFHHFVTISLVCISWWAHMTKIGLLIEMIFDSTDILLCIAKCIKYSKKHKLADIVFGAFVLNWIYTRQFLFAHLILIFIQFKDYNKLQWKPEKGLYMSEVLYYYILVLFIMLYSLALAWFAIIIKLVLKVLQGKNADDARSDSEEESESKNK